MKSDDEEHKKKFEAKRSLVNYVYGTRAMIRKLAFALPTTDAKQLVDEIKFAMKWLNEHTDAEAYVFEEKRKELGSIWYPIITKALNAFGGRFI